ncbi:MAG: hypothetical protein BGP16_02360 [Sphingobium sp. 66-54]|nr:MAG: hypothetical protein BGP16_02360 [Sphingobium sp. 66-54]
MLTFDNDLLAMLDADSRARLAAVGSLATWPAGAALFEPEDPVDAVHFPLGTTLAALLIALEGGASAEAALIGRDGMIGGRAGDAPTPAFARIVVVQGGSFLRVALPDFVAVSQQSAALTEVATRYADCLTAHLLQSVACNAVHSLEQRTARWLLAAADRTGSRYISVTQEQLGALLGAGRSYTSRQIQRFKARNLVRTRRGGIALLDYDGIARHACACHRRIQRHTAAVLHGQPMPDRALAGLNLQGAR